MEQNKEPPSEEGSPKVEKEKVLLKRTWSFWENYQSKDNAEKDYSKLLKEIYTFNGVIGKNPISIKKLDKLIIQTK